MMRNFSNLSFLGVLFILAILSGCTSTQSDYGSFVSKDLIANQSELAIDTAKQLERLYPPAKNDLVLQQETPDTFGKNLVLALREAGFAVQEFNTKGKNGSAALYSKQAASSLMPPNPKEPAQWRLSYVLDQAGEPNLYYLTLWLNHQSLTRLYRLDDNRFIPAGELVHKRDE